MTRWALGRATAWLRELPEPLNSCVAHAALQVKQKGRHGVGADFQGATLLNRGTLSVIVCNYNHAHFLPEALQAILDQSCRPLEVIVIDDASTDNSVEVIEAFVRKDPIVRLYRNEHNQGSFVSANRGLHLATGDYVYWGAADDRVLPGFFAKSMDMLACYPQAGLCSALLQLIDEEGVDKGWVRTPVISRQAVFLSPEKVQSNLMRHGFWFTGQTVICQREFLLADTGGFTPELCHYADHFVDMVAALKHGACFIPEVLATWRVMDSGYAETMFNNIDASRATFAKITQMMRSPQYASLFPEGFMKKWETRGHFGLEMRHFRRLRQNQMNLIAHLRSIRTCPTLLDRTFLGLLKLLAISGDMVAKVYLWHRRINWDIPWLVRMWRSSRSRHSR